MEIRAPLSGVIVALDAIPDPVFAGKLVGDGVSIDPTSAEVLAPFTGTVSQLHASHHALAITADNGIEVLIHVGLDTVGLKGQGFRPAVAVGQRVTQGQVVLRFDPDVLARSARSLLTEVIVTTTERVATMRVAYGTIEAGKGVLLELELAPDQSAPAVAGGGAWVSSDLIALPHADGLHARPAAILAQEARKHGGEVRIIGERGPAANAKSVVAIMGLSTQQGDRVRVEATGEGAREVVAVLVRLLREGDGTAHSSSLPAAVVALRPGAEKPPALALGELAGTPSAPGLAIGQVFRIEHEDLAVPEVGGSPAEERARWLEAVREAALQLDALQRENADPARRQILDVQLALLDDPALAERCEAALAQGKSAAFAWRDAYATQAALLEGLDNALLRERAADVRDVGRRVLTLLGGAATRRLALPPEAVLIAEEISPSEMSSLDRTRLVGLCTLTGSPTSHVSILARSMGIPSISGIDPAALALTQGLRVIIDGQRGVIRVSPDESTLARARERIAREATDREADRAAAQAPARTRDGHRVEVAANISSLADARDAVAAGAEGVGLLRSEFLFYDRDAAPTEDEQASIYQGAAAVLGKDRRLVVRTLDVGGDKPLPYLALPREANPFLGLRGIRVSLDRPELFRAQLRALGRATEVGNLHVMFPMIAGVEELRTARRMLSEELGPRAAASVKIGAMVEVPSAALLADVLASEVDFLSIGTNDLTQYALAVDRGHPKLAGMADALHPAVLRLIDATVRGAHQHDKWVGVCGGVASDPLAVPLLVGMGVDELSVSIPAIASVKAVLARWSLAECRALAAEVLALGTTEDVRALLRSKQPAPLVAVRRSVGAAAASVEG